MKTILLVIFVFINSLLFSANIDSAETYTPDVVDELLFKEALQANTPLANQTKQAAGLKDAWQFVTAPFRPVWGKCDEPGYRETGPYNVFQHHQGNLSQQLVNIRQKILAKDPAYFTLYA